MTKLIVEVHDASDLMPKDGDGFARKLEHASLGSHFLILGAVAGVGIGFSGGGRLLLGGSLGPHEMAKSSSTVKLRRSPQSQTVEVVGLNGAVVNGVEKERVTFAFAMGSNHHTT